MTDFTVQRPYGLAFKEDGYRLDFRGFWKKSDELRDLAAKQGVYIFGVRAGKGYTPIYVGLTKKNSFEREFFNAANKGKYLEGLAPYKKYTPVMFFIVHPARRGKTNQREITEIEKFMIQIAAAKNPDLVNIKHKGAPGWRIEGVIRNGHGRPTRPARDFKKLMNLSKIR